MLKSLALLFALAAFAPAYALSPNAQAGKAAMEKAQCNRCHRVTHAGGQDGIAPFDRAMNCVDCHVWILGTKGDAAAIARQRKDFPDWDRYLRNIVHFTRLPDLGTLTRRVRPSFVRAFLDGPFDLRPHLDESMIPVRLTPQEKDDVVAYLTALNPSPAPSAAPSPKATPERIAEGRARFVALGCPMCHTLGNERFQPGYDRAFFKAMGEKALLAPNLRYARDRLTRETLVRFVQDPLAVDPQSAMPKFAVSPADAEALADYLLGVEPGFGDALPVGRTPDVPLLTRKVTYDEVQDEVLGFVCVHCHMDPESNAGDGGAGNTGGLGFAGLKLSLESYASVKRGLVKDGKAMSILEPPAPGKDPLLLAVLLRRHAEGERDFRPAFADAAEPGRGPDAVVGLGMPLGLPPLTVAQVSLVKTWLAQGAPGPAQDRSRGMMGP